MCCVVAGRVYTGGPRHLEQSRTVKKGARRAGYMSGLVTESSGVMVVLVAVGWLSVRGASGYCRRVSTGVSFHFYAGNS